MALSRLRFQGEATRPDRLAQVEDDARPAATQLATAYGAHGAVQRQLGERCEQLRVGQVEDQPLGACREKVR